MKIPYACRSRYLGDPAFFDIPIRGLLSKEFAREEAEKISLDRARPAESIAPMLPPQAVESDETTHFSIVDRWGNAVSNTYTLNFSYGSKLMVPGTGILLNNQMDDFNLAPGVTNAYGLPAGAGNAIAGGKRMLSSMTPAFAFGKDGSLLVTGSPGGSRIPTVVLQVMVNLIDHKMNIAEATFAPRFHHQWHPDVIYHERGLSRDSLNILVTRGHTLQVRSAMGATQSVYVKDDVFYGIFDPRRRGALTAAVSKTFER